VSTLLSIVTINLDNDAGLSKTISSVRAQKCQDLEYIIIDGGSKDLSLKIIHENSDIVSFIHRGPDNGIYDAMNKGLKAATGEYIMFLNSGDYLAMEESLIKMVKKHLEYDAIYGEIAIVRKKLCIIRSSPEAVECWKGYQHELPFHPAAIIRRELCLQYGGFDERYYISADVALMRHIFSNHLTKAKKVKRVITIFDETGLSSKRPYLAIYERIDFIARNYPHYIFSIILTYVRMAALKLFKITAQTCRATIHKH